jgi:hypothetical protein
MDVVISGGDVPTDIEVQHSEIHEKEVRRRTTRYYRAGYLPVWFNDAGGDRPRWLYEVPALGCNALRDGPGRAPGRTLRRLGDPVQRPVP